MVIIKVTIMIIISNCNDNSNDDDNNCITSLPDHLPKMINRVANWMLT